MWVAERLAEFVSKLRTEDVPLPAREMAKRCVLDLLGVAVAGGATAAAGAIREIARVDFATGPSGIWFVNERRRPAAAAFANSAAASALDLDDGHRASGGHPGASIIPAAFAAADETGATGGDLLAAIVIGYEVAVRIAASRDFARLDTHATGCWSAFGAAAAAGWLRRLPPETLAHALAIAGAQAPGLAAVGYARPRRTGHAVKEGIPWSTLTGLVAVDLAERHFTGPLAALDHPDYFDAGRILDDLGRRYAIERVYFKPYACCRWIHGAIDALFAMQAEHGLGPGEIGAVRVSTFRRAYNLVNAADPDSHEAAQFSFPFCLAVAAYEGAGALLPLSPSLLGRRELVALAERVELRVDPELDALFPARTPAMVVLETARGTLEKRVDHPLGDPENPMDLASLREKFGQLTDGYWPSRLQEEVADAVLSLETDGLERLTAFLRRPLGGLPGP